MEALSVLSPLAIGALGSCRVHTPLTQLAQAGEIKFKTDSVIGYLHNPLEIIQAARLLKGIERAPAELAELMNIGAPSRLGDEDRFAKLFTNVDILVVEISSVRIVEFRGWQLQINRVREFLHPFGVQERDLGALFASRASRIDFIDRLKNSPPALAIDLIAHGNFYELRKKELMTALRELRELVDLPIAFVGVVTKRFDGRSIRQRLTIRDALDGLVRDFDDAIFIDPMPLVEQNGIGACMLDLGHYRREFEPAIAKLLRAELSRFSLASAAVQRLVNRRRLREQRRTQSQRVLP